MLGDLKRQKKHNSFLHPRSLFLPLSVSFIAPSAWGFSVCSDIVVSLSTRVDGVLSVSQRGHGVGEMLYTGGVFGLQTSRFSSGLGKLLNLCDRTQAFFFFNRKNCFPRKGPDGDETAVLRI